MALISAPEGAAAFSLGRKPEECESDASSPEGGGSKSNEETF